MSGGKRFLRSGKKSTSDDNAGNFVFSFPGSASPNQSFTFGSAPSSPVGSPAGFGTAQPPSSPSVPTFGGNAAPSSPSASSNVFVFGAGSTSSLPGSPKIAANFGATNNTAPSSPTSSLRRTYTDITQQTPANTLGGGAGLRRSNSDLGTTSSAFTFGSPTNTPSAPSAPFTFGSGQNQAMATQPAPSTTATSGQAAPAASAFTFGSSPATNTTPASPFSFGNAPTSGGTSSSTGGFGSPTIAPSSTGEFGSPTIAPSASSPAPAAFSFGSSTPTAAKTTVPPPSAPTSRTSAFSFGSPAPPPSSTPSSAVGGSSTQISVNSSPALSFGTASTTQKTDTNITTTPSFSLTMPAPSSTTASSTPAASPFSATASTAATTTPTTTAAATTTSAPTFSFSIPSTATDKPSTTSEKKDDTSKQADKPATSSLFSFGSTPAKPSTSSAAATTTTSATSGLPSFSFSAPKPAAITTTTTTTTATPATTTTAPNAFSFTTTLENLDKTAQQPPHQIGAALITPALNALRQNQVVTHTNFRIDNILPSTRFTELPEQARKELDELAQYIHGESQRCDYIKKRAAPKRQETMKEAKHEYEILSYKLDSLSNSLQMQVNAVEELFDLLKEQIRHFNDGQSVLDACRHPGVRLTRRLSGYSNDDDYFMVLSTRLATRMEEYKRCIREIEFTTESWTKNHAQSPQDIARIMASQNQTFLALTNQVAALHETLKMEQDLYSQYRIQAVAL